MTIKKFLHRYLLSIIFYGIIAIIILTALGCIIKDHTQQSDWEQNRDIAEIYINEGDTLWGIAQQYKPNFMDIREYIHEIQKLNNLDNLYAGDVIQIYTWGE